jgi:hypothetical protein
MEETREGSDAAIVALEGIHWAAYYSVIWIVYTFAVC